MFESIEKKYESIFRNANLFFRSKKSVVLLIVFSALILIWRRPGQVFYPYIWDEDGVIILAEFLNNGFMSIFDPVQGYYITSSKLINFLAYKISFWYYPEIAAFLANLFITFVVAAIAYCPTYLKYPWICAVFTLLVKTNSECFSVALYSFWWAGLLLILVVLWKKDEHIAMRNALLLIGGFSSPLIVFTTPMLCFRAIYQKNKTELTTAIVSLAPFAVQVGAILKNSASNMDLLSLHSMYAVFIKYFGRYLFNFNNLVGENIIAIFGVAFLITILISGVKWETKSLHAILSKNIYFTLLIIWLGATILSSMLRVDIFITDPYLAGPRYYFYPYIIISWLIIWVVAENRNKAIKLLFAIFLVNFIFDGSIYSMSRDQIKMDWRNHISNSINYRQEYQLPIYFDGTENMWSVMINGDDCKRVLEESLIFNNSDICLKNEEKQ